MLKQLYIKNFTLIDELTFLFIQDSQSSRARRVPERASFSEPSDCSWATVQTARPSRQEETDA